MKEKDIQRAILDLLAAKHILAFRMNSGTAIKSYGGKTRAITFGVPGMADILAFPQLKITTDARVIVAPFPVWIEVKGDSKQSDLQKSFQAQVEAEGHRYILARSIEDVEAIL